MTVPTPTLEQLAATVATMQADILRLQNEVAALQSLERKRQDGVEWLRTLRDRPATTDPKPQPREAENQR